MRRGGSGAFLVRICTGEWYRPREARVKEFTVKFQLFVVERRQLVVVSATPAARALSCPSAFRLPPLFGPRLEPGFLHDPGPAFVVLADAVVERGRRAAARDHAVAFEVLLDRRVLQRLVDGGIERVDDGLRRAARRHRPDPQPDLVAGNRPGT